MLGLGKVFSDIRFVIGAVYIALGLVPGAAAVLGLIEIPPSLRGLIIFLIGLIGFVTFVCLVILIPKIKSMGRMLAVAVFLTSAIVASALCVAYFNFARTHVEHDGDKLIVLPLEYRGDLKAIIEEGHGGNVRSALNSDTGDAVRRMIRDQDTGATWIMALLMCASEFFVIIGLFGGVLKLVLVAVPEAIVAKRAPRAARRKRAKPKPRAGAKPKPRAGAKPKPRAGAKPKPRAGAKPKALPRRKKTAPATGSRGGSGPSEARRSQGREKE
jgi:hypothetical protein